jgi:hypothetical protein
MVVPEFSATLEYPNEIRVGLNGNHLTIAKYNSRKAENFVTIATALSCRDGAPSVCDCFESRLGTFSLSLLSLELVHL